ncbi:MAG: hypothetical protein V7L27_24400 [Nostoc sp.]|uniref:hypothetical protein n=1 Tax=Nostoc sp. TaxID=1180 RepID=UPI002FFB674C
MKSSHLLLLVSLCLSLLLLVTPLRAEEGQGKLKGSDVMSNNTNQQVLGAGNTEAIRLAEKSPLVQSAKIFLVNQTEKIKDIKLRKATLDAIDNPTTCIMHRSGLTDGKKQEIVEQLLKVGLVDAADDMTFPGGLIAGIFPPVSNDGSVCPQLPQSFFSAPGSGNNSHHTYPGGLPIHEAFNNISNLSFASNYRLIYGQTNSNGLPIVNPDSESKVDSDIYISNDLLIAAPIWHDWAKSIVFQWNASGTEFQELNFGGNGKTDNYGASGDSRTGGHHIISLAETMKRKLSPEFVITQACAHSSPTLGNEYKVVNWLHTAAIVAGIDPVAQGYLFMDKQHKMRLPIVRKIGNFSPQANSSQTNLLAEYAFHNLSDADFVLSIPAVTTVQEQLRAIAPQFGYNPTDTKYILQFRNPVLSYLSAERLLIIYSNHGVDGVITEIRKLSQKKII